MEWWPAVNGSYAVLLAGAFALSAFVTWLSIFYARRGNLIDQPGRRRSHVQPTPRGGGIGIVASALVFWCLPGFFAPAFSVLRGVTMVLPLILVAGVGWVDDHRPLSARVRLTVHFLAALFPFVVAIGWSIGTFGSRSLGWMSFEQDVLLPCVWATLIVWSINLHNFMDGINGLLSFQAAFVFMVLGALFWRRPDAGWPLFVLAAALLGFLPFNFPHARTFMGDVGSGAVGLLIALAVQGSIYVGADVWPMRPTALSGIIACSAFVVDATCNLLSRMLRGKRWYSAHREHLYQWMVRSGMSHRRVVAWYMGWNLAVVVPVLCWLNREPDSGFDHGTGIFVERNELVATIVLYAVGVALWIFGKRWCLQKVKSGQHDAAA
jgi:UDP-N-acetylmuramyl pentapeptide phosphotransferase/UDP-N-acetylglucosamine-1-phosphate transferase